MGCASSKPEVKETAQENGANPAAKYAVTSTPAKVENAEPAKVAAAAVIEPAKPEKPSEPEAKPAEKASEATDVNNKLKELNSQDANTVQETLMKVSLLIQKFAEGRNERTTPVQALRRALELVVADCQATFASVQCISENKDAGLLVALVGAPDPYLEKHRLQRLGNSTLALEQILNSNKDFMTWSSKDKAAAPSDWQQLAEAAGLQVLSAVPIKVSDKHIGLLTIGFDASGGQQGQHSIWPTYMQLISASLASMIKDNSIPRYMSLVRDIHDSTDLDSLMHKLMQHFRVVLGHTNNHHVWYRVSLTASTNTAATIFDDLTQVPAALMQRATGNSTSSSSSMKLLKEVQANGGIMRTVVAMKSTVMKISIHNRQQVMIPDVQKLINQSGNVSIDIFNTRLIKPPTSVLVFPLKVKQHIFGVIFCMSSVQSDFSDVSPRLRELCEVMSPHLLFLLSHALEEEYKAMQLSSQQNANESSSAISHSFSRDASMNASMGINASGIGIGNSQDSFVFTQSRSSTGALVTGLTEKLNQKRIKSSMDYDGNNALGDLQITNLLGEGGFAKVFRGLWRSLVVGIKVVCDDGKNEKMVMKNAHEIAILSAISHPNIVQAYTCMTDVLVRDMLTASFRSANAAVMASPAYKYLMSMEDKPCHIEVIEYCDLGNLSTALKNQVFIASNPGLVLSQLAEAASQGSPDVINRDGSSTSSGDLRVNMRTLILTLIEIASAMGDLHRMGIVHCDLKPANVLLKSSNNDPRGFTAKVSDFGLSRVEDDDTSSSFPFNSCGTAAYVAPEALICNKKVNSSVDVYAYGILMWEMYTAQRPYGNMKQQQLVEEVVMRGLRPKFPLNAPAEYMALAQACWNGSPQARPTFVEAMATLNQMLASEPPATTNGVVSRSGSFTNDAGLNRSDSSTNRRNDAAASGMRRVSSLAGHGAGAVRQSPSSPQGSVNGQAPPGAKRPGGVPQEWDKSINQGALQLAALQQQAQAGRQ